MLLQHTAGLRTGEGPFIRLEVQSQFLRGATKAGNVRRLAKKGSKRHNCGCSGEGAQEKSNKKNAYLDNTGNVRIT
jgi:hypothetical protein